MEYNFRDIEEKWQKYWAHNETFKARNDSEKPKYFVLDMFPYPSGAGLHVGHPLGYIASDIYARFKRHKGFNVLHPQGFDSFGLPAEQYAIQTGQHPVITTQTNIATYRKQLDRIGFSFDWSREISTSSPNYYKWTQWIFTELFKSWYNKDNDRAESIDTLVALFEKNGNECVRAVCDDDVEFFTSKQWNNYSFKEKESVLAKYRLTYLSHTQVNWCAALGTVLANDEIINGVSERGSHPVVRKKMMQWSIRITAYAKRLLEGLKKVDWPESIKDIQKNWIGESYGACVNFQIEDTEDFIKVFTTRVDTIFGVTFITLAPEHDIIPNITTSDRADAVRAYIEATAKRSELERQSDTKTISGEFTGAYAIHPFTKEKIPIWIGDYVLIRYGTGAVMAVPCGDQRDWDFAKYFGIKIKNIFQGVDISKCAYFGKDVKITNSDFLNGLDINKATKEVIYNLEQNGIGYGEVNYRLRDAVFSRQRYWGEPFPIYYKDGVPQTIDINYLPLKLPEVENYLPTKQGKPPLGNAFIWAWDTVNNKVVENEKIDNQTVFSLDLNTMPGWAGSSWYFNRYMDSQNQNEFVSSDALNYWRQVDLYIGGSEHATGHLLYARFWQKFLFDKGLVPVDEFAKKLVNQGMIMGSSAFVYNLKPYCKITKENGESSFFSISFNPFKKVFFSKNYFKGENSFITDKTYSTLFLNELKQELNGPRGINVKKEELIGSLTILNTIKGLSVEELIRFLEDKIQFGFIKLRVDISLVNKYDELDIIAFKNSKKEYKDAVFELERGKYIVAREVEKMSKSKYNVVNPDEICQQYGADSLRLFEMFLGPLDQSKPWNTAGISGVHSFLKKLWRLFFKDGFFEISQKPPLKEELKVLHQTIKKVERDIYNLSFNTSVSTFMIAVNEFQKLKCNKRSILEPLLILISPYAPHITEELWSLLGHKESISVAEFPVFNQKYLVDDYKEYPISFNGKIRFKIKFPLEFNKNQIEQAVMQHEKTKSQLKGIRPKRVIVVIGKIVNIVV